jgi:hypothetical protein
MNENRHSDIRKSGIALIAGSLGGIVTMAIHPTMATPSAHLALLSGIAHGLALVSVLVLFLGSCGIAKFLAAPDRLAFTALVTYGLAAVAIMTAGAISGWVVPGILNLAAQDIPANAPQWHIAAASIFQINQAFARIYSVAAGAAIVLWSIGGLRIGRLSRRFGIYGVIASPVIAVLILIGHLRLNVHGMAVVMLSEVIWFVGVGVQLLREKDATPSTNTAAQ